MEKGGRKGGHEEGRERRGGREWRGREGRNDDSIEEGVCTP